MFFKFHLNKLTFYYRKIFIVLTLFDIKMFCVLYLSLKNNCALKKENNIIAKIYLNFQHL